MFHIFFSDLYREWLQGTGRMYSVSSNP